MCLVNHVGTSQVCEPSWCRAQNNTSYEQMSELAKENMRGKKNIICVLNSQGNNISEAWEM